MKKTLWVLSLGCFALSFSSLATASSGCYAKYKKQDFLYAMATTTTVEDADGDSVDTYNVTCHYDQKESYSVVAKEGTLSESGDGETGWLDRDKSDGSVKCGSRAKHAKTESCEFTELEE
jgi:hypothetical protein